MSKKGLSLPFVKYVPRLSPLYGMVGSMLIHVVHGWAKNGVQKEGYNWCYASNRHLGKVLCVSERTIASTIKALRLTGILVVAQYNTAQYDKTNWYRLDYQKFREDLIRHHPELKNSMEELCNFCMVTCAYFAVPIQKINKEDKESKEKEANADALQEQQTTGQKEETGGDQLSLPESKAKEIPPAPLTRSPEMVVTKNSADILADMKQKRLAKLSADPVKVTPTAMGLIWKVELAELEGVTMVKNLTQSEIGQMKSIINVLGTEHACPVIRCVLRNWVRFTKKAAAAAGLKTTPDLPHIGFLLKYVTHAHALWVELGGKEPAGLLQSTATAKPVKRGKVTIIKNTVTKGPNLTQPSASKPATPNLHTPVVPPSDSGAAGSASEDDELVTLDVLSQFDE